MNYDVPLRRKAKSQDCDKHMWKKQKSSKSYWRKMYIQERRNF